MRAAAVASALTYATNHGVSLMFLCSTVESEHWLSKLSNLAPEGSKMIRVKYLCEPCAKKGCQGICPHGELQIPAHIEADAERDLVKQAMELVMPGSYQLEVCGSNLHTASQSQAAFDAGQIDAMNTVSNAVVDALYVALDPVQAGSGHSGIGLAVVGRQLDKFVVSFLDWYSSLSAEKGLRLKQEPQSFSIFRPLIVPSNCPICWSTGAGGNSSA